jgi:hypothetical protein
MAARREEIFEGPHIDDAPDVVYTLEDGACTVDLRLEGPLFERATWRTGTGMHRFDGILIACGPDIQRGRRLPEAEIIDVAPTILEIFGVPIPSHMEGRVVHGLLTQAARRAAAESEKEGKQLSPDKDGSGTAGAEDSPYSEDEARQVEERLKRLGYL